MFYKIKKDNPFNEIMDQIISNIKNGNLKSGDPLPAERTLAETFGASRPVVREVIKTLDFLGIITSVQGGANYVSKDIEFSLIKPLSMLFDITNCSPRQIQELRVMLECQAARLAAKNSTPIECAKLNLLMEEVNSSTDMTEGEDKDFEFHLQIAKMTGNPLIYCVLAASVQVIEEIISETRKYMRENMYSVDTIKKEHLKIYEAIAGHDPDTAEKVMKKHLKIIDNYIDALEKGTSSKK